jgi:hypothetical protein
MHLSPTVVVDVIRLLEPRGTPRGGGDILETGIPGSKKLTKIR